jgi:hypothetical protein
MKNILLKYEDEFFFKICQDKTNMEAEYHKALTWEKYFVILYGINHAKKLKTMR